MNVLRIYGIRLNSWKTGISSECGKESAGWRRRQWTQSAGRKAHEQAEKIIENARAQSISLKEEARKKADALLKEAGEEAAARGREEGEQSAEEGLLERQALREAAGKRMEEAVKTVIRELIRVLRRCRKKVI